MRLSIAVLSFLFSACAGTGGATALVRVKAETVGTNCRTGGSRIESGLDANANGMLDPTEVTDTQYVCNGASGADGSMGQPGQSAPQVLVQLVPEPAGMNCANGGQRVLGGPDTNGNAVLDPSEVSVTNYVCDGAPGPGITWQSITGPTQAVSNMGYLAHNPSARVVITLPASPAVGDIVEVTGVGAGGFSIAQNAGQVVDARNLGVAPGTKWTAHVAGTSGLSASVFGGRAVASSADGMRLVAAGVSEIYTSTDSGATWTARSAAAGLPSTFGFTSLLTSSGDGTKLVFADPYGSGKIWISSNAGISWATPGLASGLPVTAQWISVASSADGAKLVLGAANGQLWTSANAGTTWTAHGGGTSGLPATASWSAVASSVDGTKLAAAVQGGSIYTSTNSGSTWAAAGAASGLSTTEQWGSLASSADGNHLVAASVLGRIWTSANSGGSWTARDSVRGWTGVASSADGRLLVAVSAGLIVPYGGGTFANQDFDQIYTSSDFGATWTARDARQSWRAVASSSDGTRLTAISETRISTSTLETTSGTAGSITGGQGDSLSLQHVGGGAFVVLTASGDGFIIQ